MRSCFYTTPKCPLAEQPYNITSSRNTNTNSAHSTTLKAIKTIQYFKNRNRSAVNSIAIIKPPIAKLIRRGLERCIVVLAGKTRLSSNPSPIMVRKTNAGNNSLSVVFISFF